ncbi:MAG: cysteine--tRNA ligase, partial [Planctomycetes bacterium]|nr:cysteine--tRNA ligase [Planctomycetota bacterium]
LILQSHYRSTMDFSDAALAAAQSGYDKITDAVIALRKRISGAPEGQLDEKVAGELDELKGKFEDAMNEDLNTAVALSVMFELVRVASRLTEDSGASGKTLRAIDEMFTRLGGDVLGIVRDEYASTGGGDEALLDHLMGMMIQQRKAARDNKDFAKADEIRDKLLELGIVFEDKPGGETTWRRQ